MRVHFQLYREVDPARLPAMNASTVFVGEEVDDRGRDALAFVTRIAAPCKLEYFPERMTVSIDSAAEIAADDIENTLNLVGAVDEPIVIEATTLGLPELFLILSSALSSGRRRFQILYVAPKEYRRDGQRSFDLSDQILGFRPIPAAIVDLSSPLVRRGIFFLGYESERLDRAFEEHQMIRSDTSSVVFGVPGYRAGWELDSIVPHLDILSNRKLNDIKYCAADNPSAAFDVIQMAVGSLQEQETMFVAPLGTKPCGIGAAVAAAAYPDKIGLIYDHPRKKQGRSTSVGAWHIFDIFVEAA